MVGEGNDDAVGLGIRKIFIPQDVDEVSWMLLYIGVLLGELVYEFSDSIAGSYDLELPFATEHVGYLCTGDDTNRMSYIEEDFLLRRPWEGRKHW